MKKQRTEIFNSDLSPLELSNYSHTLLRMIFDRWQHARQMAETGRNLTFTETNNETFFDDFYALIRNLLNLTNLIRQDANHLVKFSNFQS